MKLLDKLSTTSILLIGILGIIFAVIKLSITIPVILLIISSALVGFIFGHKLLDNE